jgi:hypothetical protein
VAVLTWDVTKIMSNAGIAVFTIIILMIAAGAIYWIVQTGTDDTQKMLDKGCTPLTANQYGFPTTYRCP